MVINPLQALLHRLFNFLLKFLHLFLVLKIKFYPFIPQPFIKKCVFRRCQILYDLIRFYLTFGEIEFDKFIYFHLNFGCLFFMMIITYSIGLARINFFTKLIYFRSKCSMLLLFKLLEYCDDFTPSIDICLIEFFIHCHFFLKPLLEGFKRCFPCVMIRHANLS